MKHFCLALLLLVFTSKDICTGQSSSVNLIVENGISLVGPHCPGTARLLCEGVDLAGFRWRYNGNIDIKAFFSDAMTTAPIPLNQSPAFLTVELTQVSQDLNQLSFGNFSSILTVDLSQLEEQNVTDITCGDSGTSETVPVNVPDTPNITEVTATYQAGALSSVQVSWMKVTRVCPTLADFESSVFYEANLTGSDMMTVNQASCGQSSCQTMFTDFSNDHQEYELTLLARSNIGSGDLLRYPTRIANKSQDYFTAVFLTSNCQSSGQCMSNNFDIGTMCTVEFIAKSMNTNLSQRDTYPLDTMFELFGLASNSDFVGTVTVLVNGSLQVIEQLEFSTGSNSHLSIGNIVILVIAGVCIVLSVLLLLSVVFYSSSKGFAARRKYLGIFTCIVIFLVVYLLLLVAFLIAFGVIVGQQSDTCDQGWQGLRDGLLISILIISVVGFVAMLTIWIVILCIAAFDRPVSKDLINKTTSDTTSTKQPEPEHDLFPEDRHRDPKDIDSTGSESLSIFQRVGRYIVSQIPSWTWTSDSSEADQQQSQNISLQLTSYRETKEDTNVETEKDILTSYDNIEAEDVVESEEKIVQPPDVEAKPQSWRTKIKQKLRKQDKPEVSEPDDECRMLDQNIDDPENNNDQTQEDDGCLSSSEPVSKMDEPTDAEPKEKPWYKKMFTSNSQEATPCENKNETKLETGNEYDTVSGPGLPSAPTQPSEDQGKNYGKLDQSSVEPRPQGAGIYDITRSGDKSKPVVNMEDPNYGHLEQDESSSDEENRWRRSIIHNDKPAPAQQVGKEESLQRESSVDPMQAGNDDISRSSEKSIPVVSVDEPDQGHVGRRKPSKDKKPTKKGTKKNSDHENTKPLKKGGKKMKVDLKKPVTDGEYDTLSHSSQPPAPTQPNGEPEQTYDNIDQSSIEQRGAGIYAITRAGEMSKPVVNMEDPNYGHLRRGKPPTDKKGTKKTSDHDKTKPVPKGGKKKKVDLRKPMEKEDQGRHPTRSTQEETEDQTRPKGPSNGQRGKKTGV